MISDSTKGRRSVLPMTHKRDVATLPLIGAQSKRIDAKGLCAAPRRSPDHIRTGGPEGALSRRGTA